MDWVKLFGVTFLLLSWLAVTSVEGRFTLHIIGFARAKVGSVHEQSAYTMKVENFCKAMGKEHTIYYYGVEGSQLENAVIINTVPAAVFDGFFPTVEVWSKVFIMGQNGSALGQLDALFDDNTVAELRKRYRPGDFLLATGGHAQAVTDHFRGAIVVEMGIGYPAHETYAAFRVYESYAAMHNILGHLDKDNRFQDTIIPPFFDTERFPFSATHEGYFLFVGRIIRNKGIDVALKVTKLLGARLLVMGAGDCQKLVREGFDNVECVGVKGFDERNRIMSKAKALFYPTVYTEPGGCAAIEAMLTGTPVISTDHGVFSETVVHGVTGFRCRMFQDFVESALMVDQLDRATCRRWAERRYGLQRAAEKYTKYFKDIERLRSPAERIEALPMLEEAKGWYRVIPNTTDYASWMHIR